jgi:hypothetical protein
MGMNRGWGGAQQPTREQRRNARRNNPPRQGGGGQQQPPTTNANNPGAGFGGSLIGNGGVGGVVAPPPDEGEWVLIGHAPDGRAIYQNTVTGEIEYRDVDDEEERPPRPTTPPAEGNEWVWDGTQWVQRPTAATTGSLRASLQAWINANFPSEMAGQAMAWVESVLTEGRPGGFDQIILDLQQQQFFLDAYPELAARRQRGLPNVTLESIRSYRTEAKRLARTMFGTAITDQQIANLIGNDVSIEEFGHRLTTFKKMQTMGGPVKAFFEEAVGYRLDDQDLYEWFDNEIDTAELDEAFEEARLKGTPVLFGLNPRSQTEADALQMMMANTGVSLDEVVSRMQAVGQNATRFQRLGAIQSNVLEGLPDNFGEFMKDIPNELLWQAEVWQNPHARAIIQNLVAREAAGWRVSGGAASAQGGQQIGLLTQGDRATL